MFRLGLQECERLVLTAAPLRTRPRMQRVGALVLRLFALGRERVLRSAGGHSARADC